MGKIKWNKLTLGFRVAFWFQSHSLRLLWCGGGASSLNECGGGGDQAEQVARWWRLGRGRRAVVVVRAFVQWSRIAGRRLSRWCRWVLWN